MSIFVRKLTLKQSKKDIFLEIIRFLLVGGFATIVDYIVFYVLKLVVLKNIDETPCLLISTLLGFLAGLFTNWFLQKFVYRNITDNDMKSKKVFIKFVILSFFGLFITEIGILLAKPLYNTLILSVFGLFTFDFYQLFFKCLMTVIVLIINYLGRKFLVFNNNSEKEDI